MTIQSLTCKSFRTIYRNGGNIDDGLFHSLLVKCILQKCSDSDTIHEFFSCLDTRRAWALSSADKTFENKIYRLFHFPKDESPTRKRLRDILRIVRSDNIITTEQKERFLYLFPVPILRLLYHSLLS